MSLLEKINEIEKEISRTQKNKATEFHLGQLRARLNKYRKQLQQAQEAHGDDVAAEEMALPDVDPLAPVSTKNSKSKGAKPIKSKPAPTKKKPPTKAPPTTATQSTPSSSSATSSDSDTPPEPSRNRFLALPSDSEPEVSDRPDLLSPASCDEPHHEEEVSDAPGTVKTKKRTKKKKKIGGKGTGELEKMSGEELLEMFAAQNEQGAPAGLVTEGGRKRRGSEGGISAKLLNYRYEFQKTVGVNALFMQATAPDLGRTRAERAGGGRAVRGVQYLFVQPPANIPERDAKDVVDRYLHVEDDPAHPGWIVFKRSRRYKDLQHDFLLMVYTNQDHVIQDILHQMPFHSDALLLMASIHERDDNYASARQAIEHTIFGLQSCLDHRLRNHPETHRLSYRYPANRSYCVALFKHIILTVPRFPKTALELGKYLFNLSPKDDPLAVILMMDFLALKAKDYAYLLAFTDTLKEIKNLDLLPNFAFSVPLAYYLRCRQSEKNADDGVEEEMAENLLMEGILRFPGMIPALFEKMEIPLERAVTTCSLFRAAQNESSEGLQLLQALYLRRCAAFWKESSVLPWLQNVVAKVVEMVRYEPSEWAERRQQYTDLRSRSYRGTPSNIWRHVLLLNIPESERVFQMRLPADGNNFIFPFDPIPPANSLERDECDSHAFSQPAGRERRRTEPAAPAPPEEGAAAGAVQQIMAATRMFLQTLWPSAEEVNAAAQTVELLPGIPARGGDVVQGAAIDDNDEVIDADKEDGLRGYLDRVGVLYDMYTGGEQSKGSGTTVTQDVEVTDGDDEDTRGSAE